jgi:hypothetical protein
VCVRVLPQLRLIAQTPNRPKSDEEFYIDVAEIKKEKEIGKGAYVAVCARACA